MRRISTIFRAVAAIAIGSAGLACAQSAETKTAFDPDRTTLYSPDELWRGFGAQRRTPSWDTLVYDDYMRSGKYRPSAEVDRARAFHDFAITRALNELTDRYSAQHRGIVGFMGSGKQELRCTPIYAQAVQIGYELARAGYLVVTGGGQGIMEAGNLGAYMADRSPKEVADALKLLTRDADPKSCTYADQFAYNAAALRVRQAYPGGHENLSIPTWFYGSQPPNVFATTIAKYFSNSIREDFLTGVPNGGVVHFPGLAATRQEVFQSQAQNYHGMFCSQRPTAFIGRSAWGDSGVFDIVRKLAATSPLGDFSTTMILTDEATAVLPFFQAHPAKRVAGPGCDNLP